jgi:hypothetical protein
MLPSPSPSTHGTSATGGPNADPPSDDSEPEPDLISFDDPTVADLGDFAAVWQYLASHPNPHRRSPNPETVGIDVPASRKQLRDQLHRKADALENKIQVKLPPSSDDTADPVTQISHTESDKAGPAKAPKVKKGKKKQQWAPSPDSSPEDDPDDSPFYLSSVEDRRPAFGSPRRKSFLYVPPSLYTPKPIPAAPKSKPPPVQTAPSASNRLRNLIQKLIARYPDEVNRILLGSTPPSPSALTKPSTITALATLQTRDLHIFIDNSNILIGFYERYKIKHQVKDPFFRPPKLDFHAFSTILERGRPVSRKILVGSNPLVQPVLQAQQAGYDISILERVVDHKHAAAMSKENPYASDSPTRIPARERKKEQAVDEILHLKILECILDVEKAGTIVLATGDAAPAEFSPDGGFLKCIERGLRRGWAVELVCWRNSMSRLWRDRRFRVEWKNMFSVIELDDFVDELVLE